MGVLDAPGVDLRTVKRRAWAREKINPRDFQPPHPSPPTIGSVASATAISSAVSWNAVTASAASLSFCSVLGAAGATVKGVSFPDTQMVYMTSRTGGSAPSASYRLRFYFDGTQLEVRFGMYTGVAVPQVFVDGYYVATPTLGSSNPHDAYLPVTFATRATRLIELRMTVPFGGLRTGPNDTVWAAATPKPRCIVVGDSYTDQSVSTGNLQGYPWQFGDLMGWPDTWSSGVGGTGYLNPGSYSTIRGRLTADVTAWSPDIVVLAAGHNDTGYSLASVTAEVAACCAQVKSEAPAALLIVTSAIVQGSNLGATYTPLNAAIQAGASGVADYFIDLASPTWWITGLGHIGATTGTGNADYYTAGDGVHFPDAGHTYFAHRLAEAVSTAIVALT